jgi:hypothetical protein
MTETEIVTKGRGRTAYTEQEDVQVHYIGRISRFLLVTGAAKATQPEDDANTEMAVIFRLAICSLWRADRVHPAFGDDLWAISPPCVRASAVVLCCVVLCCVVLCCVVLCCVVLCCVVLCCVVLCCVVLCYKP